MVVKYFFWSGQAGNTAPPAFAKRDVGFGVGRLAAQGYFVRGFGDQAKSRHIHAIGDDRIAPPARAPGISPDIFLANQGPLDRERAAIGKDGEDDGDENDEDAD